MPEETFDEISAPVFDQDYTKGELLQVRDMMQTVGFVLYCDILDAYFRLENDALTGSLGQDDGALREGVATCMAIRRVKDVPSQVDTAISHIVEIETARASE